MADALVVPWDPVLVGVGRVVLLGHEISEQGVDERLVAVCVDAWQVDRDGVDVTDVLAERLARRPVVDDYAHRAGEAYDGAVMSVFGVVKPAEYADWLSVKSHHARGL